MRNFVLCKCPTLFEKDLESPVIVYRRVERNSEDEDEGGGQRKNQKEFSL